MMRREMLKTPVRVILSVFVVAMLFLSQGSLAQGAPTPAGKVVFAMGSPHAVNASGVSRPLARGDTVYVGDRMITGRGRLQLSMIDGAFISVQPNSEFDINTYHFDGKTDGTEKATFRLVKGGVRAVTGLIGRVNKDAYKVNTAVATIGIRGTGYNTRLCSGDCGNVKDGLYHNTWEGITYVVNDVDTVVVPAGQGVYVQSINSPIIPLNQAPGITAAVTKKQTAQQQEKQDQQAADQTTVVAAGNQRTSTGTQAVIPAAKPSHVVSGLIVGGITPDSKNTGGISSFGLSNASVFQDPTTNGVIGMLGLDSSNTPPARAFATIDYNSALAGDDPTAVAEAGSLLGQVDQATKDAFLANPAQLVENTTSGNIGWGRWSSGYFIGANANGDIISQDLTGNQSLHYVYGPDPGAIPTSGTALYNFVGGTRSTSLSGASIGNGVTDGAIYVDFGSSTAGLLMHVDHNGNMYLVDGSLTLDTGGSNGLSDLNATAETTASGSACNPSCVTTIQGGFLGTAVAGHPSDAALTYDIQETDPITGIGVFATDNIFSSVTTGISTTITPESSNNGLVPFVDTSNPEAGFDVYQIKNSGGDYIGELVNDTGSGYAWLATIDILGVLDNKDANMAPLVTQITNNIGHTVFTDFLSNPAQVLESVTAGAVSMGRWGNGKILFADNANPAYVFNMQNDQSYHFINGPDPGALPTSGGAYYNFTAGTHSTTQSGVANASGVSLGTGVTAGTILVNFQFDTASLDMTVQHGDQYHVTGPLSLDATNNVLSDKGNIIASTSASGSACNPNCLSVIVGGLLGPNDSTSGMPSNLGLSYLIEEQVSATDTTPDPIMGVAAFGLGNQVGSVTQKPYVMAIIQPDMTTPGLADSNLASDAILHFDSVTGNPVGAILTTYQYDPTTSAFVSSRGFGTVDLTAMQNSDDPAAQTELNTMVTAAGSTAVADYATNPATLAEFKTDGTFGYGRWANGKLLTYSTGSGSAEVVNLTGYQSIDFIYGPDPGTLPTSGSAFYNFIGGTQSTSLSGATIGNGVTAGAMYVDFGSSTAGVRMNVDHNGNMYFVHGELAFETIGSGSGLFDLNATAETTASGSACNPSCSTTLEGGFAGSPVAGHPADIGLSYVIQETDPITGVAAFATDNIFSSVATNNAGLGVYPVSATLPFPGVPTPPYLIYFLDSLTAGGVANNVYQITDSNGNYIGELGNVPSTGYTELYTNNLYGILDNNNSALTPLLTAVIHTATDTQVTDLMNNPAQVAETVSAGSVSLGRWDKGNVLLYISDPTSTNSAILPLTNDLSFYFVNGPDPGTLPTSGAANYTFTAGTHSTTEDGLANASGVSLGTGVTSGTITVNFVFDTGTLDMTVQHGNQYHATGYLSIAGNLLPGGGTVSTTASGSACNPSCALGVFGQLFGPNDSTTGLPSGLGLTYQIDENNASNTAIDPIIGTAAFGTPTAYSGGSVTNPFPNYVFTAVEPNQNNTGVHFLDGNTGTMFADPTTGAPIGIVAIINDPTNGPGQAFGTVNLTAMQNSDNPTVTTELNTLVSAAGTTAVNNFQSGPIATSTDYHTNGVSGMGRWTNGKILAYNSSVGTAEVKTLTGNQSIQFIYGPDPGAIPTTGTATYNFHNGTQSTSLGGTIGNGVTQGQINVNFASNNANLSMVVNHVNPNNSGGNYNVNGTLTLNAPSNGISDGGAVFASGATTGPCVSSCTVNIDGGFAGPVNAAGNPSHIGIGYIINETDPITGVAGFKN